VYVSPVAEYAVNDALKAVARILVIEIISYEDETRTTWETGIDFWITAAEGQKVQ